MCNILKLKSKLKKLTKEVTRILGVMILGFILVIAMLIIKYKPIYEVKIAGETLGYVEDIYKFEKKIADKILNKKDKNIDSVSLKEEPKYELKLLEKNLELNDENDIIKKLDEAATTVYKFYAITLDNKTQTYVATIEEAEKVVDKIKSDYNGDKLELDLAINEIYTENKEEVNTDDVEVAESSIEEKFEHKMALATINGVDLSVLPVSGRITSRYGEASRRRVSLHTGLDIACMQGTDIKAVAKGKVIFSAYNGAYGKMVKIKHENGIETWYAHCSKLCANVGEKVEAGEVIAEVGSTGNSTGPHLHLEIRINGKAVNPQKYLYNK